MKSESRFLPILSAGLCLAGTGYFGFLICMGSMEEYKGWRVAGVVCIVSFLLGLAVISTAFCYALLRAVNRHRHPDRDRA